MNDDDNDVECGMNLSEFLRALATVSRSFDDHARVERARGEVSAVESSLAVRQYEDGLTLELYVDLESLEGVNVCWWLEARLIATASWRVTGELLVNDGSGQRTVGAVPDRITTSEDQLSEFLTQSARELLLMRPPRLSRTSSPEP